MLTPLPLFFAVVFAHDQVVLAADWVAGWAGSNLHRHAESLPKMAKKSAMQGRECFCIRHLARETGPSCKFRLSLSHHREALADDESNDTRT